MSIVYPSKSKIVYIEWLDVEVLLITKRSVFRKFTKKEKLYNLDGEEVNNGVSCYVDRDGFRYFIIGLFIHTERVIWHESLHMTHQVMDYKGIPIDGGNTEVQAYLQGFISQKIKEFIGE